MGEWSANNQADRTTAVWDRLLGLFGDALLRKFGAEHPQEWETGVGYLTDAQIDRGFRRLVFGWKGAPPSLPDFVRICRAIGDDTTEEGPQPHLVALPSVDAGKYDYWDTKANGRFLRYVGHRLTEHPSAWGKGGSRQQADSTRIAVGYKHAWAQDMREADRLDPGSGEIVRMSDAEQDRLWSDCMKRAEADIVMFLAEKAA